MLLENVPVYTWFPPERLAALSDRQIIVDVLVKRYVHATDSFIYERFENVTGRTERTRSTDPQNNCSFNFSDVHNAGRIVAWMYRGPREMTELPVIVEKFPERDHPIARNIRSAMENDGEP